MTSDMPEVHARDIFLKLFVDAKIQAADVPFIGPLLLLKGKRWIFDCSAEFRAGA